MRRAGHLVKLVVGALALVLLVTPTTVERINLSTSTYLCSGYAGCQAAGYGNYGYRQASGTSYWQMYVGHNCTNYVAYRLIQTGMPDLRPWKGSGNASNWGVAMASITDQTPTVGSVAWYGSRVAPAGANGHVAIVEQVISDTEIVVSEDYWGGDFHWRRVTKTGGGWPSGFIHFNDRVVAPTTAPAIVGSPAVGAPLEVAAGAWTPTPTSVTVRWLADGAAIPGATSAAYVPTPDVKGKALAAEVTASLDGYTAGRAVVATAPVAPGVFQPAAPPTIQGTPEVGQTLTLGAPSWSPQPAKVATQWYADGKALPKATGGSLVLTRDHIGALISARTTASASGYKKSRTTASAPAVVAAKAIAITSPSRIKGTPQVGSRLVARVGTVRPGDAKATFTWLRDGRRIAKATKPTYTVRKGDVGRHLSVRITLARRHFRDTTQDVAVATPVTTVPEVKVRSDASRKRVAVDVRVRAPGVPRPEGTVTVTVGRRTVEVQLVKGKARAVVRGLRPGTKPVVVRYAGTDVVQAKVARSRVTVPSRR
ncbi:CHAP domain-containing protein [Nocardioides hwasunensis]|uniref:CHAP domain-containing protein n=1 Tax=Nocardioides hwasunensis TaxID=397258 RepID=A0ABR8MG41_9ACTN|nr:CHAP domain-containing protein [Nocardioides hwasunensis]MBD3915041.1 CHAP domain-containing protein [Nocardioides hwasunensis]